MMPMPVPPPPVQAARTLWAPDPPARHYGAVVPMAPVPQRFDPRPVEFDRWGRMSGLGAETERMAVPDPGSEGVALPIACAVLGFLFYGLAR